MVAIAAASWNIAGYNHGQIAGFSVSPTCNLDGLILDFAHLLEKLSPLRKGNRHTLRIFDFLDMDL